MLFFSKVKERATIVKKPIVPINDKRDPSDETVFQNVNASG